MQNSYLNEEVYRTEPPLLVRVVPGVASFARVVNYERKMFMKQVANIEMESTVFASLTHRAGHIQKHSYI